MNVYKLILTLLLVYIFIYPIDKNEKKASKYFKKGYSSIDKRAFKDAIKFFKSAIKYDLTGDCGTGVKGIAYSEISHAYIYLKNNVEALSNLNKCISINPKYDQAYIKKSIVLMSLGKSNQAIEILNELIIINPQSPNAFMQRAWHYESMEKYKLAILDYETFMGMLLKLHSDNITHPLYLKAKKDMEKIKILIIE